MFLDAEDFSTLESKLLKQAPLSPSKITSPSKKAEVEGMILSIAKGKGNYWDGELLDGRTVSRFVLFEKNSMNFFYATIKLEKHVC